MRILHHFGRSLLAAAALALAVSTPVRAGDSVSAPPGATSGNLQDLSGAVTDAQVPNDITIDNAATADALSANGANCSAGQWAAGTDAAGAAEGCTADDDVPESGDFGAGVDLEADGSLSAGVVAWNAELANSLGCTGTQLVRRNSGNTAWECAADSVGTPADAIPPAADDGTGAVGVGTDYAREDHKHPVQTSTNTPSAATGDVAATNVQAAIAELASEKLATSANNDTADDLTNNNLTDLADVVITSPANTQVLTHNGTSWVNAAAPGFTPSASLAFQIGASSTTTTFAYTGSTLTQYVGAAVGGVNPLTASSANDATCFSVDILDAGRGRATYTCAPTIVAHCRYKLSGIFAGSGAADGEGLDFGIAHNNTMLPLSQSYIEFESTLTVNGNGTDCASGCTATATTTSSGFQLGSQASGEALLTLSQNDIVNLAAIGYGADAGSLTVWNWDFSCEEAGSTGQAGADGADGGELLRLWLEAPTAGTLPNFYRNVTTQTASAVYCITDTGTADVQLSVDDGSPANMFASVLSCSSTEASTTTFGGANGAALPAGSYIEPVISNVAGSPGSITLTVVPQ